MLHRLMLGGVAAAALLSAACGEQDSTALSVGTQETVQREFDPVRVRLGGELFAVHCAECHGAGAQGDPNWRRRDDEGMFPPPPLNGTGHAWHHPRQALHQVIKHGSPPGQGRMPAWEGRLSDEEIAAIIDWFQAQWLDEVYAAWYRTEQRSRDGN